MKLLAGQRQELEPFASKQDLHFGKNGLGSLEYTYEEKLHAIGTRGIPLPCRLSAPKTYARRCWTDVITTSLTIDLS